MSDRRPFVLAAAILAGGCAVNQDREVSLYRSVLDKGTPANVQRLSPAEALSLARAILLANQHNEQIALSGEDYVQALIDKTRAAAGFLPTVDLSAGYSINHANSRTTRSTSVPLRGSISLLDFRNFSEVSRAAAAAEQRRLLLLDLQSTVLLEVAQTYYQILRSERSVRVVENSLSIQAERVRDMQAREGLGMSKPLDLAQAQADESRFKVLLLQARSDVRNGRATLAFLTGEPAVDGPLLDEFDAPAQAPPVEDLDREAHEYRSNYLAAHYAVEAASRSVESAVRQYFPTIGLSASDLIYSHPDAGTVWGISFSALVPIFSAGLIHADVRAAWSRYRQARLSESQIDRQIHEDVAIAAENLATSRAKVAELKTEVGAAQRAFDLADAQYRLGSATNLDRLTAQDALLNAQLQLTTEEYNLKVFYLDLLRATGRFDANTPGKLPPAAPEPGGAS